MADLNRGYIKLWRKVDKNPVWTQLAPAVYKVFTGCLLRANWKEMKIYNGSEQVTVSRGAFLTSLQDLATYCNVTRDQARGAINHLEGMDFIFVHRMRTGGARLGLLVTIRNYEKYQVPSDFQNTVEARSGPIEPPLKNTVADSGKEVVFKFRRNQEECGKAQRTPEHVKANGYYGQDPQRLGFEWFAEAYPQVLNRDELGRAWSDRVEDQATEDEVRSALAPDGVWPNSQMWAEGKYYDAARFIWERKWREKPAPAKQRPVKVSVSDQVAAWKAKA